MISLDQVLLLEKKVESAVAKIAQLNAENAALRSKCAELTNALSAKTEQFSTFQTDQRLIEEGILKALNRLESVENAVLSVSGENSSLSAGVNQCVQSAQPVQKDLDSQITAVSEEVVAEPLVSRNSNSIQDQYPPAPVSVSNEVAIDYETEKTENPVEPHENVAQSHGQNLFDIF